MTDPASTVTIVLADDHRLVRESLARLLDDETDLHVVETVANGQDALEAIRERKPAVAVLDMQMPELTGLEVVAALDDATRRETGLVLLTALRAPELARRALDAGFAAIVLKSDAFDDLVFAIRAVVGKRQFVSASLSHDMLAGASAGILSDREREVLTLIAQGLTNKQIGVALEISPKTVDNHRTRLMRKLDAHSTADLVRYSIRVGLVDA